MTVPPEPDETPADGLPGSSLAPEEPLIESAPLMHEMALRLCTPDRLTGDSCFPYHAAWQYLRHLDLIKTLGGHASFFLDGFRALASEGKHRACFFPVPPIIRCRPTSTIATRVKTQCSTSVSSIIAKRRFR